MGDLEIRKRKGNATKWKKLAKEDLGEGGYGSSHANFKAFVDLICS